MVVVATPVTQDPPTFRAEANLVVLHVNVFDKGGQAVDGLSRENFFVYEDDRPQTVSFFTGEDVPVAVGLVIDNSSSMIHRRDLVVAGGMAFAKSSHPEDELFTVSFTEHVRRGLPPQVMFTSSRSMLQATLVSLSPGGKTALYDAMIEALDHIERATHQKRVLIVLSDGDDNASSHTEKQMLARAQASDVIIYTVGVSDPTTAEPGDAGLLRDLAAVGGGRAYFPKRDRDIVTHFEQIATAIRHGYSIGYEATSAPAGAHSRRVKVMVKVPGRKGLTARYRQGYATPNAASIQR